MTLARFYSYRDKLVIPTVAQAEEGFYLDKAPVTVCDTGDRDKLKLVLSEVLQRDNEVVPTPERAHPYDAGSPVLEKLKLKRWLTFEAEAAMYSVHGNDAGWEYYTSGNAVDGSWRPNQTRHLTFAASAGLEPLISQLVNDIQSDVRARNDRGGGGLALLPPPRD